MPPGRCHDFRARSESDRAGRLKQLCGDGHPRATLRLAIVPATAARVTCPRGRAASSFEWRLAEARESRIRKHEIDRDRSAPRGGVAAVSRRGAAGACGRGGWSDARAASCPGSGAARDATTGPAEGACAASRRPSCDAPRHASPAHSVRCIDARRAVVVRISGRALPRGGLRASPAGGMRATSVAARSARPSDGRFAARNART